MLTADEDGEGEGNSQSKSGSFENVKRDRRGNNNSDQSGEAIDLSSI